MIEIEDIKRIIHDEVAETNQQQFADKIGVTRACICHIIKGKHAIGDKVTEGMGFVKHVIYKRKK